MDFCSVTVTPNFPFRCGVHIFIAFLKLLAVKRYYRYGIGIRILVAGRGSSKGR